jgi:YggT family protein
MFVFGNLMEAVAWVIGSALDLYLLIIIARAIISWVNPDPYNPIVQFLYRVTEPVLRPIRKRLSFGMGIDFSPIIVIMVIYFLKIFLVKTLVRMAYMYQ